MVDADKVYGEGRGDTIHGGDGADSLGGGDRHGLIIGGDGADSLYRNGGDDRIDAREPPGVADIFDGGHGNGRGGWEASEDADTDMEGNFLA